MNFPRMMKLAQHFEVTGVEDVAARVREELAKLDLSAKVKPGQSVAVTVGSRGIANLALIIETLVRELKALGAEPFIVPAMGSHGGATAQGQRAIVEGYGVTEERVGAPIRATMEVVQVGRTPDGIPVYFDKYAHEADHVVVVGRIKPHTDFQGRIESGLHKMMLIGLGKHQGAQVYHQAIVRYSFDQIIASVAQEVIDRCRILLGLAIVENQNDETALIEAVPPESFAQREGELLVLAKRWIPKLPFEEVDLLIVDQMGKNISGSGLDTNVVGRKSRFHRPAPDEGSRVTRIYVRDLTDETHGNATGVGVADYTHKRLVDKVDWEMTYLNCITGSEPRCGHIPIHFETDRKVLEAALRTVGFGPWEDARVLRIKNTLEVREVLASEVYLEEALARDDLTVIEPPAEMAFDGQGDLLPF